MRIVSTFIGLAGVVGVPAAAQAPKPLEESSVNARVQMERFATCVADRSPEKAARTISMHFRSTTYRSALRNLADANRDCYGYRSTMRAGGLSFAGALAERLLERDTSALNVRIIRAGSGQTAARSPSPPGRRQSARKPPRMKSGCPVSNVPLGGTTRWSRKLYLPWIR